MSARQSVPRDYYEVLGVDRGSSDAEIKRAFRRVARDLHPDVNRHDPEAEEKFKQAAEAYEVLSDPERRRTYDAFGRVVRQSGDTVNLYLFAGERRDATLGWDYLRARYLNPALGRFASADPFPGNLGESRSLHRYLYTYNDPVNKVDPSGLFFSLGTQVAVLSIITILANIAISGFVFGAFAKGQSIDGLIFSGRLSGAFRGFGGGAGVDVLWDFKSGKPWFSGVGEVGLVPLSLFKGFSGRSSIGLSATAGIITNMTDPQNFSGWGFAATWPVGALVRRRRRMAAPFEDVDPFAVPAEHTTAGAHPHEHGERCGHPAVTHGDHVDYVHDGHRHAAHGDHYDEH